MEADLTLKGSLEEPRGKVTERLRSWLVDRIKRRAIHHLHRSRRGEVLLLRIYMIAECKTADVCQQQQMLPSLPEWLKRPMAWHLAEEQTHVEIFSQEIASRGAIPDLGQQLDWITRHKIRQWERIAERYIPRFQEGALIPAYAIGLCAEQMARRVLTRHSSVIPDKHPLQPILRRVLRDEEKHIRLCKHVLERLVSPSEQQDLANLLREIRTVDRSWGTRGAIIMYLTGLYYRVTARIPEALWQGQR